MIHLDNIFFGYTRDNLFDGITADLPNTCSLLGENGSGKTTLLRLVAGILHPQRGQISLDDKTVWRSALMLDSSILMNDFTISRHLDWMRAMYGEDCVNEASAAFEIGKFSERRPCGFSEGERQWCALCLTMCMPCDICLLDEPMRGLDEKRRAQLREILCDAAARGTQIMVTGHEAALVPGPAFTPVYLPGFGTQR